MAPAKIPCSSRTAIACFRDVDVPKKQHVKELPRREIKSIARAPCRSAAVAFERGQLSPHLDYKENIPIITTSGIV